MRSISLESLGIEGFQLFLGATEHAVSPNMIDDVQTAFAGFLLHLMRCGEVAYVPEVIRVTDRLVVGTRHRDVLLWRQRSSPSEKMSYSERPVNIGDGYEPRFTGHSTTLEQAAFPTLPSPQVVEGAKAQNNVEMVGRHRILLRRIHYHCSSVAETFAFDLRTYALDMMGKNIRRQNLMARSCKVHGIRTMACSELQDGTTRCNMLTKHADCRVKLQTPGAGLLQAARLSRPLIMLIESTVITHSISLVTTYPRDYVPASHTYRKGGTRVRRLEY